MGVPAGNVAIGTALASVEYIQPNGVQQAADAGPVTTVPATDTPRYVVTVTNPGDIRGLERAGAAGGVGPRRRRRCRRT